MSSPCFVGIAVAKEHLAIACRPGSTCWSVPNDSDGIATCITRLPSCSPRSWCAKRLAAGSVPWWRPSLWLSCPSRWSTHGKSGIGCCPSIACMKRLRSDVGRLLIKLVAKVRRHAIAQQLLHSPYVVRYTCCHGRRDRLPPLR
jgi:hypothetical protein